LDLRQVKFRQFTVILFIDQAINQSVRNSANSSSPLQQIRFACHSSFKPAGALHFIGEVFPRQTEINNDFTVGERDGTLTHIGGNNDFVSYFLIKKSIGKFF
jgi:hypothetical protein